MSDTTRCEPPPELRGVDGWHVLYDDGEPELEKWHAASWWDFYGHPSNATQRGVVYGGPFTPPAEVAALKAEVERERMRLVACGVVAMSNTQESAARNRAVAPEYDSASLRDVASAVDREMALRAEVERLRAVESAAMAAALAAVAPLIRAAALDEAAGMARMGCLTPPDGGNPTADEVAMCDAIAAAIRALKETPV